MTDDQKDAEAPKPPICGWFLPMGAHCGLEYGHRGSHVAWRPKVPGWLPQLLEHFANTLVARYGHPVYLVGSALDTDDPYSCRDIDIVVVLPDEEFFNRFGAHWTYTQTIQDAGSAPAHRWTKECGKLARSSACTFNRLNIDFKVQSQEWVNARHKNRPRLRLDRIDLP